MARSKHELRLTAEVLQTPLNASEHKPAQSLIARGIPGILETDADTEHGGAEELSKYIGNRYS